MARPKKPKQRSFNKTLGKDPNEKPKEKSNEKP